MEIWKQLRTISGSKSNKTSVGKAATELESNCMVMVGERLFNEGIKLKLYRMYHQVSNILFILLPPILIHLYKEYAKYVNPSIHIIWILLFVVGCSSAYFHATLSLFGQLLDEVAIIWVFMAAFAILLPTEFLTIIKVKKRRYYVIGIIIVTVLGTVLSFWHPAVNAFALMFLSVPVVVLLYIEIKSEKNPRIYRLGVRCATVMIIAVVCWVNDKFFCDAWSLINFPYLHGIWHILIFISSYSTCVLFSYYSCQDKRPDRVPIMKYWPRNDFEWGVPYVAIKSTYKDLNEAI